MEPGAPRPLRATVRLAEEALADLSSPLRAFQDVAIRLASLAELVTEWSVRIDLTGHRSPEAILRKLIGPALALYRHLPGARSLADLGSGAGFPGLPLALLDPALRVTLIESRERRHHFQRHVVRALAISNASPLLGRAESLPPSLHDVVLAQAVGPPAEVVTWALRWVRPGGRVLIPGRAAGVDLRPPGIEKVCIASLPPPLGEPMQVVWIGTRASAV